MGTITLNIKAKKKPVPVVDQLNEASSSDTECSSFATLNLSVVGTKWMDIIFNNGYGYATRSGGVITGTDTFSIQIDAFKSFQESQNVIFTQIDVIIRASNGGAVEDRYRMEREHTSNIC